MRLRFVMDVQTRPRSERWTARYAASSVPFRHERRRSRHERTSRPRRRGQLRTTKTEHLA